MAQDVLVITGAGGMGLAVARRLGSGFQVLLADVDPIGLEAAAGRLSEDGYRVTSHIVDVSSRESVAELAKLADGLGPVTRLVHTAGLSPVQASSTSSPWLRLLSSWRSSPRSRCVLAAWNTAPHR